MIITLPNTAFNAAVHAMAAKVWLRGYDISDDPALAMPPADPAAYWDDIRARGRPTIYTGGSERTIFGEPEFTYDFRAWHEWTHLILRASFNLDGELAVAHRQCEDIALVFGHSHDDWRRLIMAEVYGQALFFHYEGRFPRDQVAFDRAYIAGEKWTYVR
jgi:hypothetical protein